MALNGCSCSACMIERYDELYMSYVTCLLLYAVIDDYVFADMMAMHSDNMNLLLYYVDGIKEFEITDKHD